MALTGRKLSRKTAMQGRPVRIPAVRSEPRDNGGATITVMINTPRWARLVGGRAQVERSYGLDRYGKQVYDACDGKTSVRRIVKRFAAANGLGAAEAEMAVSKFLQTLMAKGLIAMEVPTGRSGNGRT